MRHVVVGTAGHVDHGKTTLVRRLTGVDTDRLPEEKQRGLTIDLGFAPLDLPDGTRVSIVDVPGHERFIKNMVAGVTGIDIALLVVAADEGVMPQTQEHLDILDLLNVEIGVIAVTKVELVDDDWLQLVIEDIKERVAGTTMASAAIVPVSAVTGRGLSELVAELQRLANVVKARPANRVFRLPVDRVFSVSGHGTVVTGTVVGGSVRVEDPVVILPQGIKTRVRSLQVHGQSRDEAVAGDRCALNLAGVEKQALSRGCVVAHPEEIPVSQLFDVRLRMLPSSNGIRHGRRVRVLAGASEIFGQLRLLGADSITGGDQGYGQLRLEEPLPAVPGDLFILRELSPAVTVGGGKILAVSPRRRRRHNPRDLEAVQIEDTGTVEERVLLYLRESSLGSGSTRQGSLSRVAPPVSTSEVAKAMFLPEESVAQSLNLLEQAGEIVSVNGSDRLILSEQYERICTAVKEIIAKTRSRNPLQFGIGREELRSQLLPQWDLRDYSALLQRLVSEGRVRQKGALLTTLTDEEIAGLLKHPQVQGVLQAYDQAGFASPPLDELEALVSGPESLGQIIELLVRLGELVPLEGGLYMSQKSFASAKALAESMLDKTRSLTAAGFRDALGTGRKMAIAILETLDAIGITRREGDVRVPGPRWQTSNPGELL